MVYYHDKTRVQMFYFLNTPTDISISNIFIKFMHAQRLLTSCPYYKTKQDSSLV